MSLEDKIKWNKKYKQNPILLKNTKVCKKLMSIINICKGVKALEVACGGGRNSIFLAQNGFEVDALDISEFAIDTLKKKSIKNINTKVIDLEGFKPQNNNYDLIVKTNYLDRKLIPNLIKALKKGGILFVQTYMEDEKNEKSPLNPLFLLKKGELKSFFDNNFEILDYDEFFGQECESFKMKKQSIIVKKLNKDEIKE